MIPLSKGVVFPKRVVLNYLINKTYQSTLNIREFFTHLKTVLCKSFSKFYKRKEFDTQIFTFQHRYSSEFSRAFLKFKHTESLKKNLVKSLFTSILIIVNRKGGNLWGIGSFYNEIWGEGMVSKWSFTGGTVLEWNKGAGRVLEWKYVGEGDRME